MYIDVSNLEDAIVTVCLLRFPTMDWYWVGGSWDKLEVRGFQNRPSEKISIEFIFIPIFRDIYPRHHNF